VTVEVTPFRRRIGGRVCSLNHASRPSCAILVPSYRRATDLSRCLGALRAQSAGPNQVVVVIRADDDESRAVIASACPTLPVTEVLHDRRGQVAALNAGLQAVTCDITAITDDDTAPHSDWVARLLMHFDDPAVAAVGGRDVVLLADDGLLPVVGRVGLCGRVTGNHHRGMGPARPVDVLKGANMAFRTEWLRRFGFDDRLRGTGAEVHNDLMLSLKVRGAGGNLVYDPAVLVDHYTALRPEGNHDRTPASLAELTDEVHNETLALMEFLPAWRRGLWLLWVLACGTRRRPGLGACVALLPRLRWSIVRTLMASLRGRFAGLLTWRLARRQE
jgi:GT2 family glycosyltransferase